MYEIKKLAKNPRSVLGNNTVYRIGGEASAKTLFEWAKQQLGEENILAMTVTKDNFCVNGAVDKRTVINVSVK